MHPGWWCDLSSGFVVQKDRPGQDSKDIKTTEEGGESSQAEMLVTGPVIRRAETGDMQKRRNPETRHRFAVGQDNLFAAVAQRKLCRHGFWKTLSSKNSWFSMDNLIVYWINFSS
ncbi:unnamed protein product [Protopolystoma xenopodis]|uniref:Uncharacterized protein n=1 Tax=Protopolystoma xenopodis TaxID=117903 RepID=A0A448WXB9_9PLAT|nr:unnamed protein product [Protopolystoma xenopodis]